MARGCSTLQPNFNKCDTNKYGQFKSDKYCYCKKSYCNTASKCLPNFYCLGDYDKNCSTNKQRLSFILCYRSYLLHVPPPIVFGDPRFLQMTQKNLVTVKVMLNQLTKLDQWLTLTQLLLLDCFGWSRNLDNLVNLWSLGLETIYQMTLLAFQCILGFDLLKEV